MAKQRARGGSEVMRAKSLFFVQVCEVFAKGKGEGSVGEMTCTILHYLSLFFVLRSQYVL